MKIDSRQGWFHGWASWRMSSFQYYSPVRDFAYPALLLKEGKRRSRTEVLEAIVSVPIQQLVSWSLEELVCQQPVSSFSLPSPSEVPTHQDKRSLSCELRGHIIMGKKPAASLLPFCEQCGRVWAFFWEERTQRKGLKKFKSGYWRSNLEVDHLVDVLDSNHPHRLCKLDLVSIPQPQWQSRFDAMCKEAAVCRLVCVLCHERPGRTAYE
mmetsp:Transcript_12897/g.25207  ORF Transcript_12897/g.25207 Transcript_12897/m.25207 type:complete len:210 (+) Transcript_12897:186-815(+)